VIRQPRNLNKIKVTQLPRKQRTVGRKMIPLAEYAILFSLWNVVGFVEISQTGECQWIILKIIIYIH
jgi:hypothetical protein